MSCNAITQKLSLEALARKISQSQQGSQTLCSGQCQYLSFFPQNLEIVIWNSHYSKPLDLCCSIDLSVMMEMHYIRTAQYVATVTIDNLKCG